MKEKIYKYLCEENRPIHSAQLLEKFFYSFGCPGLPTEKIIETILINDPRFVKEADGSWSANRIEHQKGIDDIIFSLIEFDIIPIGKQRQLPIALAIGQIQNLKPQNKQLFTIESPVLLSDFFQNIKKAHLSKIDCLGTLSDNLEVIYQLLSDTVLINDSPLRTMERLNWFVRRSGGIDIEIDAIDLRDLIRKLKPEIKGNKLENIATAFGLNYTPDQTLAQRVAVIMDICIDLLINLKEIKINTMTQMQQLLNESSEWINFASYNFDENYIKSLPECPGVYFMKNRSQEIFYIGKAKNLRSRISSYFVNKKGMDKKGEKILKQIHDLQVEVVGSELEALLRENKYINQFQPALNKQFEIHQTSRSKNFDKKIVAFLPSDKFRCANLFLINGVHSAIQVGVNLNQIDYDEVRDILKKFFFGKSKATTAFNCEQIAIMWRWINLFKNTINYFDIENFGNLDKCQEILMNYLNDSKLFIEKIEYH